MSDLRVLVTGTSGLLGRAVFDRCLSRSFDVKGWAFSRSDGGRYERVDLTNAVSVTSALDSFKPDVIIHCAAIRQPNVVQSEYERSQKLNVDSTETIACFAAKSNCHLIYLSTDYVFDGHAAPYAENALPNPLNTYGKLKLAGEDAVRRACTNYTVLRVPVLYGDVQYLGEGAIDAILKSLLAASRNASVAEMSDYEKRYPTHVEDVARIIMLVIDLLSDAATRTKVQNILHWSGDEEFTKYEMALIMCELFGISTSCVKQAATPVGVEAVSRPYNAHLDSSALRVLGARNLFNFRKGITECLSKHVNL